MLASTSRLAHVLAHAPSLRLQILFTPLPPPGELPIDAPPDTQAFRADAEYFYPASTVKLLAALAIFHRLPSLSAALRTPITEHTALAFLPHPALPGLPLEDTDPGNALSPSPGRITIASDLRRALIVSENPPFNRLYDMLGHTGLNTALRELGFTSAVINHRLSDPRPLSDHLTSRAVQILSNSGQVLAELPPHTAPALLAHHAPRAALGNTHADPITGALVEEPMDFSHRNRVRLIDLHHAMIALIRPDAARAMNSPITLNTLAPSHRDLLANTLRLLPSQCPSPSYPSDEYPDDFTKPLLPGLRRVVPSSSIHLWNKVGRAYGTLTDTAVVHLATHNIWFALALTLEANTSGQIGTDRYDYETLAIPFFNDLAESLARELLRVRAPASTIPLCP